MGFSFVKTPTPVYVHTLAEARNWLDYFYDTALDVGVGYDTETTGLDVIRDRVRFFSMANQDARICAPLRLLQVFEPLLTDPDVEKRMTNTKYDRHLTANHGIQIRGRCIDTADEDWLLDENRRSHGLKACAQDYLGLRMTPFKKVFGDIGKVQNEVQAMVDVHDILELHDFEGNKKAAHDWAMQMMILMKMIDADPDLMKALKKVDLSIKGGFVLDGKKLLTIARKYELASMTRGKQGYVSDFSQFLGGPALPDYKERPAWAHIMDDPGCIEEAHWHLWHRLVHDRLDIRVDPVEELRARVSDYASLDAWASFMLVDYLRGELDEEMMVTEDVLNGDAEPESMAWHSEEKRVPFVETLWYMERRGFRFDAGRALSYSGDMKKKLDGVSRDVVRITKDIQFKMGSPDALRKQFYKKDRNGEWVDLWGDPPKKMTKGGASGNKQPSTDKETLQRFAGKGNELAKSILEFRQFDKLNGTYMEKLPTWIDRRSRIHTQLKSIGARTGRLASADPNLQNIPARDPVWGQRIRQLFIAGLWGDCSPDLCMESLRGVAVPRLAADFPMRLIVADYKQLEMRIMAHFSQDEGMIQAILDGLDLHCQTVAIASERGVPGIPPGLSYDIIKAAKAAKDPDADQEFLVQKRGELKSTGFGIIYGIGALKLGMQLGLPIISRPNRRTGKARDTCPEAQLLIRNYLNDIYPGVGEFIEVTKDLCREELAVHTIIGRARRLPDIRSRERGLAAQAERQAPNARIQGSAADITNEAMLRCEADPLLRSLGVRLLLQVHDELVFEVPDDDRYAVPAKKRIRELMEDPFPMRVPIEIDIEEGYNWGDAKG